MLLSAYALTSFGQKQDTLAFEGAAKIIVITNLSAKENFALSGKKLIENNYFIASKDLDFYQLISDAYPIEGNSFRRGLILYVVSKDNEITITPRTRKMNSFGVAGADTHPVNEPITYTKKLEMSRTSFNKALDFAKTIGGKVVFTD